jgi:ABC-type methionine transport system ATPase subunit
MAKKIIRIELTFPEALIKEPVIYTAAKKFNFIPNIRKAEVTQTTGKIELELEGTAKDLEKAIEYFERKGIEVRLISEVLPSSNALP